MQAYTELAAPTAVTHSLTLSLTSPTANNLVVAKGSILQIFTTRSISVEQEQNDTSVKEAQFDRRANDEDGLESSFLGGESMLVRTDRSQNTKLVLVAEIPLAGTVIGLARIKVKQTASGGEALLLAYKAAKLCLTEWDPHTHTLETISLHYYEKDELQAAPWDVSFNDYVNYLEADPGSRCAAFMFGARNIAILPFKQPEGDLEMDDWDEDLDGPRPVKEETNTNANGTGENVEEAAYTPSFVLRLPLLDPSLLHPVHLAFLHEYREPTFGILSADQPPSVALGAKDYLTYKVFTLDLQQRASTTILSVTGLPRDLKKVMPLPAPIGGALLIGENELIHVDQSGKANGVAVNQMTRQITSFSLSDQSDLNLRLEGCIVGQLSIDHGELLLVLNDGRLALVSFNIDGRTVSGLEIKMVSPECGGELMKTRVSCITKLNKHSVFVGSTSCDSVVLGWTRKQSQEKRKRSRFLDADLALEVDELDLEDEEDDDDLYGDDSAAKPVGATNGVLKSGDLTFSIHDTLLSLAPIQDFTPGKPGYQPDSEESQLQKGVSSELQLVCAVGRGKAGSLAIINREVQPKVIGRFEFPEARGLWTLCVKKPLPKNLAQNAPVAQDYENAPQYDKYMIVAKVDLDGYETSDVYALTAAGFETLKDTEFEPTAGFTVEAGIMGKQMRIIQVLKSEVRCYDGDLDLAQILPMQDEETGQEYRVLSASIADPYLSLIRDDGSVFVAQIDSSNELEEMDKTGSPLASIKWVAGCLYTDSRGVFQDSPISKGVVVDERIMMFLLSSTGALHIYALPDLSRPVFVAEGLVYVPPYLSTENVVRKGTPKETLSEILVADLGDEISSAPYLILRHSTDDLTLYEPIKRPAEGTSNSVSSTLCFKKAPNSALAKSRPVINSEDDTEQPRFVPLRRCQNVGGYSTVFLPGPSPSFILKASSSTPHVVGVQGLGVRSMSPFHTEGCDRGFIYADDRGIARVTQLPSDTNLTQLGVSVKKVPMDTEVRHIAFHHPTGTYIAGCTVYEPFELPRDDDYHKEWAKETLSFYPTMPRGQLKLVSPTTWTAISELDLESCETIESMKTLHLEVSEDTKERRMLLVVGSSMSKGEDLPTRGRIQALDIVTVIPEPGRPETNKRLKLIAKEDIPRGGISAVSSIGTQGLMLVAQGQKCMVRGLKEDGSLLPVAFLDMNCHVSSIRSLPRSGLCLISDAFKGVWFAGYTEEPYTFKVLGKGGARVGVVMADFLPNGDELGIVVIDTEGEMHILEFNPEHPKTLQGSLLLHRTTFNLTPNPPSQTLLLPHSASPTTRHILLMASASGAISTLSPLPDPSTHRRLASIATHLNSSLPSSLGLNAKAYRMPADAKNRNNVGVDSNMGRGAGVVDASVLARWTELGAVRRAELVGKGGFDGVAGLREEVGGVLGWSGLDYF